MLAKLLSFKFCFTNQAGSFISISILFRARPSWPSRQVGLIIVHYDTSAMKRFPTSVSLQHEPKATDVITLVKKTFFARATYEILYHQA